MCYGGTVGKPCQISLCVYKQRTSELEFGTQGQQTGSVWTNPKKKKKKAMCEYRSTPAGLKHGGLAHVIKPRTTEKTKTVIVSELQFSLSTKHGTRLTIILPPLDIKVPPAQWGNEWLECVHW